LDLAQSFWAGSDLGIVEQLSTVRLQNSRDGEQKKKKKKKKKKNEEEKGGGKQTRQLLPAVL